jgi:hypothetical protein
MTYANIDGIVGNQQIAPFGLPDTTSRQAAGTLLAAVDNYWGGGEFLYVKAGGSIRQYGLVVVTPAVASGAFAYTATETPNTANLGRMLGVAMTPMTTGQFGWICVGGIVPVNCSASVAADTAFGIAAAGQGGAIGNGKQVLNARIIQAATATVVKTGVANSGSTQLNVSGADGWFIGAYLSGTGVGSGATITDISPDGTTVTMSLVSTAAINGSVTATYNNATIYYNIAHVNRPFAQGQIA